MERARKYFDLRGFRGAGNLTAASTLYGTAAQQAIKNYGKGNILEDIPSGIDFFLQSRTDSDKSASGGKPIGTPSSSNGFFRNNSQMDAILDDSNWASEPGPDGSLSSDDCGARISLGKGVAAKPIYLDGNTTLSAAKDSFDETELREEIVDAIRVLDTWRGDKDEIKDSSPKQYNEFHRDITSNPSYAGWNSSESSSLNMKTRIFFPYTLLAGLDMAPPDALTSDNHDGLTMGSTIVSVGSIVGGVIGGIILLVLLALAIILAMYHRRWSGPGGAEEALAAANAVDAIGKSSYDRDDYIESAHVTARPARPMPVAPTTPSKEEQVVNQSNAIAPEHWQLKERDPGEVIRQGALSLTLTVRVIRSVKSLIDYDYSEEERDHDSG
ncbi:hypothetical protein VNI00_015192 [Paramarasmius palmivorus]|uniref:Uncharacterized protein n=1 Tax=Paramarasmius palmivorus TaxID=297713 RepID=A0AAW0BLN0_9AGAR